MRRSSNHLTSRFRALLRPCDLLLRLSREGGNPAALHTAHERPLDSRLRGNDGLVRDAKAAEVLAGIRGDVVMEGWRSVPLTECIQRIAIPAKIPRKQFEESGEFPVVSQEKDLINGYWSDDSAVIRAESPLVVFGDHTQVLKYIDFDFVVGADGVKLLQPKAFLNAKFLYYFLAENPIDALGYARHFRLLKNLGISFPKSLPEQARIVAILDEAFAAIATATANAEKNLANARELFESQRKGVLEDVNNGWTEKDLGELVTIKHGFAFKSDGFVDAGEHVLLTPGNFFEEGGYRDRGEKQKYYTGEIPDGFILSKGDLLVAMTEQAAGLLGSPLVVPESRRFLHNQRLGLVQPLPEVLWCTEFFYHIFNTRSFRMKIHAGASGVKVRHTSPKKMYRVKVRYPESVAGQQSVASQLSDMRNQCLIFASRCERKIALLAELKQSILHKAFTGELTADAAEARSKEEALA